MADTKYTVTGTVASRARAGVGGLRVEIVDKNAGLEDAKLGEAKTDERGRYEAELDVRPLKERGKQVPDLQARVYGQKFLAASPVRYNASNQEILDVLISDEAASALPSEYETLIAAIASNFKGKPRELKENDERQDITHIANKTGWDARAVALVSLADLFSAGAQNIDAAFFYALFRAGVAVNENALYRTEVKSAAAIWQRAIEKGVIPAALKQGIPAAAKSFQALAEKRVLDAPAPAGLSSLKEMLSISLGDDAAKHAKFAQIQASFAGDPKKFWQEVNTAFGEAGEKRLRLDGQLGHLTLNNAKLIGRLHAEAGRTGLPGAAALVQSGYYRADKWRNHVDAVPIPPQIPGADDKEKRANYAEMLAAQVRLSFPTAAVSHMVKQGETEVGAASKVSEFLAAHHDKFDIGRQPVELYIAKNKLRVPVEVSAQIKRIQRVYQITPSDAAMNAMLKKGVDSAYAVVRHGREEFMRRFKGDMGEESARLVYAKAQQVHGAVVNIAVSYVTAANAPRIGVHSAAQILDPAPVAANAGDVIATATLEEIFHSMDYCACEHCRSVLGPAAYLVDLLHMLDREDSAWSEFIRDWPVAHGGAPYPYPSDKAWTDAGHPAQNIEQVPLKVLSDRRPDIQNLPLTCENTSTPLPYIDLVNETLEYFVANDLSLGGYLGHDTGGARPEELLASARYDTVSDTAYTALTAARFPAPLPFNQPLEGLRRYFDSFGVPLQEAMEALRKTENVERANDNEYGWRDIWMETLRLSRDEYALLTDRSIALQDLYGFAPATTDAVALAALVNVKGFSRRVGISYEEIFEILKTRFVNPNSTLIPKLEPLRVAFSTIKKLKDGTITGPAFDALLPQALDQAPYNGDVKAWLKDNANYSRIMALIGVANPADEADLCSIDKLEFRYANPDNAANKLRPFEFVRMIRFIRLRKKLGWTIEQTDKAIGALYPEEKAPKNDLNDTDNLKLLDEGFAILLPRLGVIRRVMDTLELKPDKDLTSLLACFAPIDTHGAYSLYRQMFLSPALLEQGPDFDLKGTGLPDTTKNLLDNSEALRAAFGITEDELSQVTAALGYDGATKLTLPNVSEVFRRGWLARKLRLSVREFLLLTVPKAQPRTTFTGIDPFAAPDGASPPILGLIDFVKRLRAVSLKPASALYLAWNQDTSGKSTPDEGAILEFARSLRAGLAAIDGEFDLKSDPDGQIARARMALVYGNDATDKFFGLLGGTLTTDAPYAHSATELEQPILDAVKGIAYDDFRKRLSFTGVLTIAVRDALQNVPNVTQAFKTAVGSLYKNNQALIQPLFDRYPELLPLYTAYIGSNDSAEKKRSTLLANFLPALKSRRKRQQALQAVVASARAQLDFGAAVLDSAAVLHAAGVNTAPALDDLTALERAGLSAQFFFRNMATGNVDRASDGEADLAYSAAGSNKLPNPGNAVSGIWSGYLEAPENGPYKIEIESDATATVTLSLDGSAIGGARNGNLWHSNVPVDLRAGALVAVVLKVEGVKDTLNVRWETAGRGRETIPARFLYSDTLTGNLRAAYVRFLKAAALAAALKLTAAETAYFAAHASYRIAGEGWLNRFPVAGSPDNVTSAGLFKALGALLDFPRIKAELSPDDERLLEVLQDPAAIADKESLLLTLTRWESTSLDALVARFGQANRDALKDLEFFRRVYDAYALVRKMGVPAFALAAATTNKPGADAVRDLQAALRARYDEADWLNVLKPINDEMRALQRDALVAYILNRMSRQQATAHIDTAEKLFEYFLMDVQMDPCALTSRVRHALSSVQLFIDRCLMNLEPRVSPSVFSVKQWEWMKRYRVWEANRKIFLYPENWLEPELRDDQSPFFKEAMSELLQSDINEDSAATALLNYLSKLEEVAKLEPCGIHYVDGQVGTSDDVAHVVARTAGARRKYYYRRLEGGNWRPWEEIKLDIEDNPVFPVVWKDRLFLFWFKIIKEAVPEAGGVPGSGALGGLTKDQVETVANSASRMQVKAALCWSERYNGKWQPTKTSDIEDPMWLDNVKAVGGDFQRSELQSFRVAVESNDALTIFPQWVFSGSFTLFNTHSLPLTEDNNNLTLVSFAAFTEWVNGEHRSIDTGTGDKLTIRYAKDGDWMYWAPLQRPVLTQKTGMRFRAVATNHAPQTIWDKPFLLADSQHVFWVTTTRRIVTITQVTGYVYVPLILPIWGLGEVQIGRKPAFAGAVRNPGFVDPAPDFRSGGAIRMNLGTASAVRFGDRALGAAGAIDVVKLQGRK